MTKIKGWFNPDEKFRRNELCPCESGKKWKNCCERMYNQAMRVITAHQSLVNQKLIEIARDRELQANGGRGWRFTKQVDGSCLTYLHNDVPILRIDYHDLPLQFNNIFDAEKIAMQPVDYITYTEIKPLFPGEFKSKTQGGDSHE